MKSQKAPMLPYLSHDCVDAMRRNVEKQIDHYFEEVPKWEFLDEWKLFRSRNLVKPDFGGALFALAHGRGSNSDIEAALHVYRSFKNLTPQQAADGRMWTYLCLKDGFKYVQHRWLLPHIKRHLSQNARRPEVVQAIKNHFFVTTTRSLMRDNGLSRLWWMGYIATQVDKEFPAGVLNLILKEQDIRISLLDRPSFAMNTTLLKAIVSRMKMAESADQPLLERDNFRDWMRRINREGGVILLDCLGSDEASKVIDSMADATLRRDD